MMPVIKFDSVSVRLRSELVLDDFSAELNAGDCTALIGCNGAGKSTLLRAAMGFVACCEGGISLFGYRVSGRSGAGQRRRIAYVPQAPVLDFKMPVSVRDVVSMGRYSERGIGRRLTAKDRLAAGAAMADTGIAHLADRPIGHLSGGERQKAQLARALCSAPEALLLDEPTANLDLGAQYEFLDLISYIHGSRHLATIIVMHDIHALPASCNTAIVIDKGRKCFDGDLSDVFTRENLSHIYKHRTERVMTKLLSRGRPLTS